MKNSMLILSLCASLFLPTHLSSLIRECASIQEVCAEVKPDSFVIFDIDNTLLRPCQTLGSDEWFQYYLHKRAEQLHDREEAFLQAVDLLHGIYAVTRVKPMERCTAAVVRELQAQGVKVIGLTSRDPAVAHLTQNHLSSIGIDMRLTSPSTATFPLFDMPHALFYHGVLFTCGKSKKDALSAFFRQLSWVPHRMIVIDDKEKHLNELQGYEKEGVQFVGLRFNGGDVYEKTLDSQVCDAQLKAFVELVSDTVASELVGACDIK